MASQVKFPLAASQDSANDNAWIGVNDIKTNDSTGAVVSESTLGHGIENAGTVTSYSHVITVSDFDFSIPAGATIQGLTVTLRAAASVIQETTTAPTAKYYLSLAQNGTPIGNNTDGSISTGGTYSTYTWGGATNKLGTSVTPSDVNASTFQVKFYVELNCPYSAEFEDGNWFNFFGSSVDVDADYISVEVHYTNPIELDADTNAVLVTGVNVGLRHNQVLSAQTSTASVFGTTASLRSVRRISCQTKSYAFTGIAAGLAKSYVANVDVTAFTFVGHTATFFRSRVLTTTPASVSVTGINTIVKVGYVFPVAMRQVALTGVDTTLVAQVTLSTDYFNYTGNVVVLEAEVNACTVNGFDVDLVATRLITSETSTLTAIGLPAVLAKSYLLQADANTYTANGIGVSVSYGKTLVATKATYTVTSVQAPLEYNTINGNLLVFFL